MDLIDSCLGLDGRPFFLKKGTGEMMRDRIQRVFEHIKEYVRRVRVVENNEPYLSVHSQPRDGSISWTNEVVHCSCLEKRNSANALLHTGSVGLGCWDGWWILSSNKARATTEGEWGVHTEKFLAHHHICLNFGKME